MQHSNRLETAQIARFTPEQLARAISTFGSESVSGGNLQAHIAREALIDLYMELHGIDSRAQAISNLVAIEVASRRRQGA